MEWWQLALLIGLAFLAGHFFGWRSGRSSGKVAAYEQAHDINQPARGGDD